MGVFVAVEIVYIHRAVVRDAGYGRRGGSGVGS